MHVFQAKQVSSEAVAGPVPIQHIYCINMILLSQLFKSCKLAYVTDFSHMVIKFNTNRAEELNVL
jgi:hypothetical protein